MLLATLAAIALPRAESVTIDQLADVATLVATVGERLGERLAVSPDLAGCMVYAHLEEAPKEAVLARLASALGAEWDRDSSPWRLTRKPALRRAVRQREAAWVQSQVATFLEERAARRANDASAYAQSIQRAMQAQDWQAYVGGPVDDLMIELLQAVGPAEIAQTAAYEIRSYSNRPTPVESALPLSAATAVARYAKVERELGSLLSRLPQDKWDAYTRDRVARTAERTEETGRVLLDLFRTDSALRINLSVYGKGGKLRTWASETAPLKDGPARPSAGDGDIKPETKIAAEGFGEPATMVEPLLQRALDPLRFDPLRLQAVPGLARLARERRSQAIVPLPDLAVPTLLESHPRSPEEFLKILEVSGVKVIQDGNWHVGTLRHPFAVGRLCLSRRDLKTWLDALQAPGSDAFRASVRMAFAGGDAASTSPLDDWYRAPVFRALFGQPAPFIQTPRGLTFFLGSLDDVEWRRLKGGGMIGLASSSPRRRWMADWSNSDAKALVPEPNGTPIPDVALRGSVSFPSGPPQEAILSLGGLHTIFVRGGPFRDWGEIEGLGDLVAAKVAQPTPDAVASVLTGDYELATQDGMIFRARFSPSLSMVAEQPGTGLSVSHKGLAFAAWPPEIRKALLSRVAETFALIREGERKTIKP